MPVCLCCGEAVDAARHYHPTLPSLVSSLRGVPRKLTRCERSGPNMRLLWTLLFCAVTLSAAGRQVAITIDDLPRGGNLGPTDLASIRAMTEQLLRPFRERKIPLIGF